MNLTFANLDVDKLTTNPDDIALPARRLMFDILDPETYFPA
jgi:hypothetical protein